MSELVQEYRMSKRGNTIRHSFVCYGPKGALEVWVMDDCKGAGMELHRKEPPDYMNADNPSHTDCTFTGGKCWHDGGSLYAMEQLMPIWRDTQNIDSMLFHATAAYRRNMSE